MKYCFLQAWCGSKRFPEKAIHPLIDGVPMLVHVIERAKRMKEIDKIVVLNNDPIEDTRIQKICNKMNVSIFRMPSNDMMEVFYSAADLYCKMNDYIIRITSDCPVLPIDILEPFKFKYDYEYTRNDFDAINTYPNGFDIEAFTKKALVNTYKDYTDPEKRPHVGIAVKEFSEKYGVINKYDLKEDLTYIRLTVDYKDDMMIVNKLLSSKFPLNTVEEIINAYQAIINVTGNA